ncbi:unnamed protein product [Phytophthora fragariaefolia]|uniref:Unnamed protein product n=1 Tax=Phytophthora fragariaefolia TaxID=1490495 RepID=A0A9W7CNU6_9STRA|nr:unnamed protein product [Phytophthora fragariaefolia]
MKRTLIHPWRKNVQDVAARGLQPAVNSPTRSNIDGSHTATASTAASDNRAVHSVSSFGLKTLQRATTVAHFVHDNAISVTKGLPRKRKLHQQKSFPDPSLYTGRRRVRRNDLVPAAQPEKVTYPRWFIQPRTAWKVRWDIWIGLIIAYSVILIPYRIGFGIELSTLNYCFDSSFAIDVLFNFFTGYYDEDVLVYELRRVRQHYLRSWFVFDVASTVPLDQFLQVVTKASSSLATLKLIRVFRLFRLLKLMRLLRLKRAMQAVQVDALNAHVLQTLKSLLTIIFIIHLVACGWYMFYTWDPSGPNWVTNMERKVTSPYLVSFYWVSNTMMSVGYGEIVGITDAERVYSIFVACIGSICVGMIIANIQMLTENYDPRGIMLKQKLQDTKEFLIKRGIPRRLRHRVISQFEFHWSHRTVFDEDTLLQQFPKSLQYEILAASMEPFVKKFPFFGMTSVDFFVYAIPRLRPIVLGSGQVLVEAESVWEELYFLTSGTMETLQLNLVVGSLSPGEICGIEYLVNPRRRYTHTYRSMSKSELYAIYSKDLLEAIDKCPVAYKYLQDLAVILGERYAESARRGRRALQRQRSIRAIRRETSFTRGEPFLHKRHRKSITSINLHTMPSDFMTRMDMTVAGDEVVTHWSIVRHYSKLRISWDIVMGLMISITAITVPFRIAFDVQDKDVLVFYVTDRISDVLFVIDVILSFCTTYVDDTGVEIVDRREIRRHYLKTTFFVDIVATIPFDFIIEEVAAGNIFKSLRLIRTLKLIKLLRLMRLSKLLKMNSQWMAEFDINVDTVRLLKLLAPVMIIAHYVGCIWFYISAGRDAEDCWWGHVYFEYPNSILSKYVASIYWAITTMTTVGFGDIVPVNDYEKAYCILVLIGGTTLFAYVVGTVIEVASNSTSLMNREHEIVQRVNAYIKERGVSSEFIVACQEHLRFVDSEKTFFVENSLFDALSYSLRSELTLILNASIVSKIRFFDKKPKWFLTLILPRLVPQFYLEGDILIYQDNPVSGIFFVMNGAVIAKTRHFTAVPNAHAITSNSRSESSTDHVVADHGTIAKIYEGGFFGYKETLTETVAQYNLFAMRATGTYLLPRECLDEFEAQYPRVMDEIRSLIIQSITRQQKVVSGWQNNDAIGLTSLDRERIVELNINRRDGDHDTIRASVTGVSMLGRRHSSFVSPRGCGSGLLAQHVAAEFAAQAALASQCSPRSDASTGCDELGRQTTVEVLTHAADTPQPMTARRASVNFSTRSSIELPGSMETFAQPTIPDEVDAIAATVLSQTEVLQPVEIINRHPNSATTLSTVHPSGNSGPLPTTRLRPDGVATMGVFQKSSVSSRDVRTSQRRPSERYLAMRKTDVTALVDELLSGDGYQIQRTGSGRTQTPTVTN